MPKFLVCVYKTIAKTEVEIEAINESEALDMTLNTIKNNRGPGQKFQDLSPVWAISDCELLGLSFEILDDEKPMRVH
jgi:hypothetical protein